MKKVFCILLSICMLISLPLVTIGEEAPAEKITPELQEKLDNCEAEDEISTYVWYEPLPYDAISRAESDVYDEARSAYNEKREVSYDTIREILKREGFSEYTDAIIERIEQRLQEIDETEEDEVDPEMLKMHCYSTVVFRYLSYDVLEILANDLLKELEISEHRVLVYSDAFPVMALCLTPAEIDTIVKNESVTKLDWYSGDVFSYDAHKHDLVAEASCMCMAPGIGDSYPGINCRHLITSYGDTFYWCGEQDRMADFENDMTKVPDCFSSQVSNVFSSESVLFLDGVPNLGDYLMFFERRIKNVYIPDSVKEIGEHTFSRFADVTIYCNRGSYAEEFAKSHNIECHLLGTKEAYLPEIVYGDATGDRERNLKDVLALRKAMSQGAESALPGGADCNGDGEVNMKDVLMLRQHLAGMFV